MNIVPETPERERSIEEINGDPKYCREEILRIREAIGDCRCTQSTFDAAFSSLAMMLFYCPEELSTAVQSQLNETTRRHMYFMLLPKS